ncbi:MAG: protein-glutamate O-methyltransferase CheR [Proteobacteria bacterium]|nr:protein-glutamate O-methyltransferase CheR [Pseudomonadota bacterium]MBU1714586.1 protein-glutamate O-methyltransferase CheR [Pseudomonadota bacterium]
MGKNDLETIEFDLLLEAIVRRYGYDFRNYARASIERRVRQAMAKLHLERISELTTHLLHDPQFFQDLVANFSITVTEMFRDPQVYLALREKVIPYLATYPFIKIWHAGCATGEEVYSLAILLMEEGLLERTTIYATDFNEAALETARAGIYPIEKIKEYNENYLRAKGKCSFSSYYHAQYDSVIMNKGLKKALTIARHNLVTDQVFGEMHLIMCRNVLIYFNRELQERVFTLFDESLGHGGFLCLGTKETIRFYPMAENFTEFDPQNKIYRKRSKS